MSETDTPECPICGTSTTSRGEPFESKKSVAGHVAFSTGEHRGVGYEKAMLMMGNGDSTDVDTTDTSDGSGAADDTERTGDANTVSPAAENDPSTEAPDVAEPDDVDPVDEIDGCPDCGAELIDFREYETYQMDNGVMIDTPDDFYCSDSDCGRGWNL